jgi:hypothetical protein
MGSAGGYGAVPCGQNEIAFAPIGSGNPWPNLPAESTWCDANGKGMVTMNSFGFEYVETIGGQQITKKQIGSKPLVLKCMGVCNPGVCTIN